MENPPLTQDELDEIENLLDDNYEMLVILS